jgi:predicted RNA-binding Zn-ribbon protein involved in translation (DUF1610 family)
VSCGRERGCNGSPAAALEVSVKETTAGCRYRATHSVPVTAGTAQGSEHLVMLLTCYGSLTICWPNAHPTTSLHLATGSSDIAPAEASRAHTRRRLFFGTPVLFGTPVCGTGPAASVAALEGGSERRLIKVDSAYTSQTCSKCGHCDRKNRNGSDFECRSCGHAMDADRNAARNIAAKGAVKGCSQ